MSTDKRPQRSDAVAFLEELAGGPLTFGRLLSSIRQGEGATLVAFANKLGVSKAHLCDVEKDRRVVSVSRASAWAKKLGYDPEQFIALAIQTELRQAGLSYQVSLKRI
jgi:transcriptional regulator with XRE-family HTH domain